MHTPTPDEVLASSMSALSNPIRIALLRALRRPLALNEIEVRATEEGSDRPLARQSIRRHLDVLLEHGLVLARPAERSYGSTVEFVTNHQRAFLLSDELLRLARLRPLVEPSVETVGGAAPRVAAAEGPRLILVRGADEGATFDLRPTEGAHEWAIGRRRGLAVTLEYDPAISAENSRIAWRGGAHWISDNPTSRNGTFVNFARLARGEEVPLRHGALVGVGRSLLTYWTEPARPGAP